MGAIFLSYAREDRGFAEHLSRVLEGAGHSVWWDRRLDGGEEFGAEIEAALGQSDVVLVAWSKESVKSRWVRDEAAVGGDTGRLVPVTMDGSRPPMGFRQFHTLDLSGWKGGKRDGRTADLLHSVERRLKGKDTSAPAAATTRKRWISLPTGKPLWAIVATLVLVIAAATAVFLIRGQQTRGPLSKPQIALAPFGAASADPQLRDLAAQTRDALSQTLSQSGIPVRLVSSMPQNRPSAADFLLSGELSRNADKILATIRLDETAHGVTVFSTRFEATGDDIRNLPERIGAQMAGMLSNGATLITLDKRHPTDPAVMAELLAPADDQLQKYQVTKRVAAKAPDVPSAQMGVAFFTGFVLGELPRADRPQAVAAARVAAQRALALAPDFGDTYATWCLLHSGARMAECEDQLRTGNRVDSDAPYLNVFLSGLLGSVGRFDEAGELTRLAYTHDPYDEFKIRDMLRMFEFEGEKDEARELYQKGVRWFPGYKPMFFRNRLYGLIERADFPAMQRLEQEIGVKDLIPGYTSSSVLVAAVKAKSIAAARRACPDTEAFLLTLRCMLVLSSLGDQDGAYAIADKLYLRRVGRTPAETERIWLDDPERSGGTEFITSPAAAPMRRDPRYLQLAERTGLLAYWRTGRAPDFCRKKPEPICRTLLKRG